MPSGRHRKTAAEAILAHAAPSPEVTGPAHTGLPAEPPAAPSTAARIPEQDEPITRLQRAYLPALRWVIRRPVVTVLLGLLILVMSGGAGLLKTDFIGNSGGTTLTVSQKLPAGTSLAVTDEAVKQVEATLKGRSDVVTYQVTVGSTGPLAAFTGGGANNATFNITTTKGGVDSLTDHVRQFADAHPELGTITPRSSSRHPTRPPCARQLPRSPAPSPSSRAPAMSPTTSPCSSRRSPSRSTGPRRARPASRRPSSAAWWPVRYAAPRSARSPSTASVTR
jgi:multidrug efflux pump subunit AcrB